jgi:DNA invertase Pin-like site-specific DNA recombinase
MRASAVEPIAAKRRKAIRKLAAGEGFKLARIFQDTESSSEQLGRMLDYATAADSAVEAVMVDDLSRLTRCPATLARVDQQLRDADVRLLCAASASLEAIFAENAL